MTSPVQVTFRNMKPPANAESWIRKETAKLEEFYTRIVNCRVVVELPNRRHKAGSLYHVRIDLTVPGGSLVVNREPSLHSSSQRTRSAKVVKHLEIHAPHRDLRQAIDDAFKAMGRQLQDYARRQRGDEKTHEFISRARVSKLMPGENYGFLETPGGRQIYFHSNSVLGGGFQFLKAGTAVTFGEEEGREGPQAAWVKTVRKSSRKLCQLPSGEKAGSIARKVRNSVSRP